MSEAHTLKIAGTIEEFAHSFINEAGRTVAQNSFMRSLLVNEDVSEKKGTGYVVCMNKRVMFDRKDVATVVNAFTELTTYLLLEEEQALFNAVTNSIDLEDFGPKNIEKLRQVIVSLNCPVTGCVVSPQVWSTWLGDKQVQALLDVNTDKEVVMSGRLAKWLGIDVLSDVFRNVMAKIIQKNNVFMFGHGAGSYDFTRPEIEVGEDYIEFTCRLQMNVDERLMVKGVLPCP